MDKNESNHKILPKQAKTTVAKTMAQRYEDAYLFQLNRRTKDLQAKIKAAKGVETNDRDVADFVRDVIRDAEREI